jgi:7-cyano-7-deazaguanine reductase
MEQNKNYDKVSEIANRHLGKVGGEGYKDTYDPELLVKIPRYLNRVGYGIKENNLPFVGYDVWNAYEVSALTSKGLPVSGILKIVCPSNSQYHVESKSIKLYLNSFNMTTMGHNTFECIREIESRVARDLSLLLETNVRVKMFTDEEGPTFKFEGFEEIRNLVDLDMLTFDTYKSDHSMLKTLDKGSNYVMVRSDLLRSNCRVTNQPDWGDVFIYMNGGEIPDLSALAQYIVSHRKVNHFHEEIAEMMFVHLKEAYNPEYLMVGCLYLRRGGLDINPIRATHNHLIPIPFHDEKIRLEKSMRQ